MSVRKLAKGVLFTAAALLALPFGMLCWLEKRLGAGEIVFATSAQLFALWPGIIGVYLRGALYWLVLDECSWQTHIGFGSVFTHRGAQVAENVSTGAYCVMGHARLGAGVRIASHVSIPSGRRQHLDDSGAMVDGTRFDTVAIGPRCWIGEGAIVMADVGEGSLISAGAVVGKEMPANCLIGGNPATVLRELLPAARAG